MSAAVETLGELATDAIAPATRLIDMPDMPASPILSDALIRRREKFPIEYDSPIGIRGIVRQPGRRLGREIFRKALGRPKQWIR
jgi:hypothetical protein